MVFRLTEYKFQSGKPLEAPGIPAALSLVQTQLVTIGSSVSTFFCSSVTGLVFMDTDVGCMVFIGSSASTGVPSAGSSGTAIAFSSGAAIHLAPNLAPFPVFVPANARICTVST